MGSRHSASRRGPSVLLWGACAAAAVILTLGTTGTLSSWTQAVITNSTNSASTAKAVILQETSGANTCASSDGAQTTVNVSTCTTINKYGGTGTPLTPGVTVNTDVTFKNVGAANATSFVLTPGACSQSPTAGSGTPAAANLCTNGDLTVSVSCVPGATYTGTPWTDLVYAAAAPPTAGKTHPASSGDLNANSSWTCRVAVILIGSAGITDQGITVTQPLTWTLNG